MDLACGGSVPGTEPSIDAWAHETWERIPLPKLSSAFHRSMAPACLIPEGSRLARGISLVVGMRRRCTASSECAWFSQGRTNPGVLARCLGRPPKITLMFLRLSTGC